MTKPQTLPDDHDWQQTSRDEKLSFYCDECDIHIPVTAYDTQVGIMLYCPQCDSEMEYDSSWREEADL